MFYRLLWSAVILVFACVSAVALASDARELESRLILADSLIKTGISELGASRSFEEAEELLAECEAILESGSLTDGDQFLYQKQFLAVREYLEIVEEASEKRFYRVFPLTRLMVHSVFEDEGLAVSEQLFYAADDAAAIKAARSISRQLAGYNHPQVVIRSSPPDRKLENIVAEVLVRKGTSTTHTRRKIISILDEGQLQAFDGGKLNMELVLDIFHSLHAENLVILSLSRYDRVAGGVSVIIKGGFYSPGESVQGSPVDATPIIRLQDFAFGGFARDRRGMHKPILVTEFVLFLFCLIWAARIRWNQSGPLELGLRLAKGALLFLFGRLFMMAVLYLMRHHIPEATALVMAAWWWPATIGMLGIIAAGLMAWLGQARLAALVPGSRGAHAVGTIFGITALGAASHFVTPLLLLDEMAGFGNLVPFLVTTLTLALVFGLAARTGPPVPNYFMVFPILASFLAGTALFMASYALLWATTGLALAIALAAYLRHKVAVAVGLEEHKPNDEQAAEKDHERLIKLRETLKRH